MLEEEMRVRALEGDSRSKVDNDAVHVLDLRKTYPGPPAKHAGLSLLLSLSLSLPVCLSSCCCICQSTHTHTHTHTNSVRGLTIGVKRGECFGMIGPNGAGKTTAINMLIGYSSSLTNSPSPLPARCCRRIFTLTCRQPDKQTFSPTHLNAYLTRPSHPLTNTGLTRQLAATLCSKAFRFSMTLRRFILSWAFARSTTSCGQL